MSKILLTLRPCPWCKQTPDLLLPIGEGSWVWKITCQNCPIDISVSTTIRKSQKTSLVKIGEKMDALAGVWNTGNDYSAGDYKVIDLNKLGL